MPVFSIFTPSHYARYLDEAYESLKAQDFEDWEWVVLLNNSASWEFPEDDRIKVFRSSHKGQVIGALKHEAVSRCTGKYLVELDHDDELMPTALSEVLRAFEEHPRAGFVYSTFAHMNEKGEPDWTRFGKDYGWQYFAYPESREITWLMPHIMHPTPHNVSLIWYAPNHLRAFRKDFYDFVGGYDQTLAVLDDQDLMARMYAATEFIPIDKFLYKQRLHGDNSQKDQTLNARIQSDTWEMYEKYIKGAAWAWTVENELSGNAEADVEDLEEFADGYADSSYGIIRTLQLHKVQDPDKVINGIHKALAPNGMFLSLTPYWGSDFFSKYTTGEAPKFQVSRERVVWYDEVPYFQANLIAIKEGYTRDGGVIG